MAYLADYLNRPRVDGVPLHMAIRHGFEAALADGVLLPGDSIPSERILAKLCGVSRPTIRQAIEDLTRAGYIERKVGQGSFVRQRSLVLDDLGSFSERVQMIGSTPSSRWHWVREVRSAGVAGSLELEADHPLVELRRTRLVDGDPVMVETSHLSLERFPWLLDIAETESLYGLLKQRAGVEVHSIDERIAAVLALDMSTELDCAPDAPAFRRELLAYDQSGRPVEHSVGVVRGDRFVYSVRLARDGASTVTLSAINHTSEERTS